MKIKIFSRRVGINYVYLIKAEGWMIVDVGPGFTLPRIKRWFASLSLDPQEVKLIVLTHAHFDHAGAIAGVKKLTGAQVAIHHSEGEMLRTGTTPLPTPGTPWGKIWLAVAKPILAAIQYPGVEPDIIIGDEGMALDEFGIPGWIFHTPGHTYGSLSVLLENGDAFVGCLTHNGPPFRLSPNYPIFVDDLEQLWSSWKTLLDQGAQTIYPGHGKPFPVSEMLKIIPNK